MANTLDDESLVLGGSSYAYTDNGTPHYVGKHRAKYQPGDSGDWQRREAYAPRRYQEEGAD